MSDHHHEKQQQPQHPPLHPNIHIQAPTPSLLPAYKRLITSLLPIPYPPQFYTASLPPFSDSFALLAIWQPDPSPTSSSTTTPSSTSTSTTSRPSSQQEQKQQQRSGVVVIGGIQARIEHHSSSPVEGRNNNNVNGGGGSSSSSSGSSSGSGVGTESTTNPLKKILYIQTLAVLAPYRGLGVGSKLLEELIEMVLKKGEEEEEEEEEAEENEGKKKKNLVEEVYAHVWEVNEEGVEWYLKRGFVVVGGLVERYYRRLRPQGARLLRRRVGVGDWVRMKKGARGEGG